MAATQLSLFDVLPLSKQEEQEFRQCKESLEWSYKRHAHILQNGAGDPFYHDGGNLNLVRNHIIYYKRQLTALASKSCMPLPGIALRPTPPKYPQNYCVKCGPHHD